MDSKTTQEKREELKRLYFESAQINIHKKKLEEELLKREVTTGKRERIARRRKGSRDNELPIATIALLSGFSRDKIYHLLLSGALQDRHPVSVGQMIRAGHGFRGTPGRHLVEYEAWKKSLPKKQTHVAANDTSTNKTVAE